MGGTIGPNCLEPAIARMMIGIANMSLDLQDVISKHTTDLLGLSDIAIEEVIPNPYGPRGLEVQFSRDRWMYISATADRTDFIFNDDANDTHLTFIMNAAQVPGAAHDNVSELIFGDDISISVCPHRILSCIEHLVAIL